MHIIKPYESTITLFCRDGRVSQFPSLKAAARALGVRWISRHVGEHFRSYSHTSCVHTDADWAHSREPGELGVLYEKHYREYDYVMRDDAGRVVSFADFYALDRISKKYPNAYVPQPGSPVPQTGRRRAGRHYYRNLRHINTVRAAETFQEEGEVAARTKRGVNLLPDIFGGRRVANRADRNWKNFRRQQWK